MEKPGTRAAGGPHLEAAPWRGRKPVIVHVMNGKWAKVVKAAGMRPD